MRRKELLEETRSREEGNGAGPATLPGGKERRHPFLALLLFELKENLRNRWLFFYAVIFFALDVLILYAGGTRPLQAFASLMNVVLLLIPLFSMIFGGFSFMESLPFYEVLLSRNIPRREIFLGKWVGLSTGLSLAFLTGSAAGSLLFLSAMESLQVFLYLALLGVMLHFVFISFSFLVALLSSRKEVMLALLLVLWFYFYVIYDLVILGVGVYLGDYPLEGPLFVLVLLNPVDLARIVLMLHLEISSLMGFGAAFFQKLLGGTGGILLSLGILGLWSVVPLLAGLSLFRRRDL